MPPLGLHPAMAYLDWSLARPASSSLGVPYTNTFFLNGLNAAPITLHQIRDQPRTHLGLVKIVSGVRGVLLGELLRGSTFLGSSPGQDDCELLTAILNDPNGLIPGECGSMVIDHETNEIYGHVVGCNTSGHALIVPLSHVFSQVKYSFGATHAGLTPATVDMVLEQDSIGKAASKGPSDQTSIASSDSGFAIHDSPVGVPKRERPDIAEKLFGKTPKKGPDLGVRDRLSQMCDSAITAYEQGKYDDAESMQRRVMELQEDALGSEHPDTLESMNNLVVILDRQGRYGEAELIERRVINIQEKILGSEHPYTLSSMNNLAVVLDRQGRYGEAEAMHRQTLELRQKVLGHEHPDTLMNMNNLAPVLVSQCKHAEAEQLLRQTIRLQRRARGTDHPDTLTSRSNLAMTLQSQGKRDEAESLIREVLSARANALGREHPDTVTSINNLGVLLSEQG
ncbi:hypothetical protein B0T10DRAFT_610521, partial [Thelonectria olida]